MTGTRRYSDRGAAVYRDEAEQAQDDAGDVDRWVELFGQLGDPTRLRILLALHRAPGISVTDLAGAVGISANAASHALATLAARHLATSVRDGRQRRWSLADPTAHAILHSLGAQHSSLHPEHDH